MAPSPRHHVRHRRSCREAFLSFPKLFSRESGFQRDSRGVETHFGTSKGGGTDRFEPRLRRAERRARTRRVERRQRGPSMEITSIDCTDLGRSNVRARGALRATGRAARGNATRLVLGPGEIGRGRRSLVPRREVVAASSLPIFLEERVPFLASGRRGQPAAEPERPKLIGFWTLPLLRQRVHTCTRFT